MITVDDKVEAPDQLPLFRSFTELKNWVVYARYAEPTHQRRAEGFGIYDREKKCYTPSTVEKEES